MPKAFCVASNSALTSAAFDNIAAYRDGLAALAGNLGDDLVGALAARGVVDDDRRRLRRRSALAIPAPMPLDAPVTIATLPVSLPMTSVSNVR